MLNNNIEFTCYMVFRSLMLDVISE